MIRMITYLSGLLCLLCHLPASGKEQVRIEHFTEEDGFSQSTVMNIIQDHTGYIWVASWDGLLRYDGYHFRSYKARPGDHCPLETNRIDDLCETVDGRIHCKSAGKFYYFNHRTEEFVPTDSTFVRPRPKTHPDVQALVDSIFAGIQVRILLTDRQGGVWVASHRGLDRLSVQPTLPSPVRSGLWQEEPVRGLYEDRLHRLWVADKQGYVRIVTPDNGQCRWLTPAGQLSDTPRPFGANVYAILQDSRGDYWLGCKPGGLYHLSPEQGGGFRITHYTHRQADPHSLSHDEVYALAEDRSGRLWVGTYGGGLNLVEHTATGRVRFIHTTNRLTGYPQEASSVYCLHAHPCGALLVGTTHGLYICSPGAETNPEALSFRAFRRAPDDAHSLSNNRVMDMVTDSDGNVYLATYGGGLCRIAAEALTTDRPAFTCYTTADGLASDVIISLAKDCQGHIWCASEAALSCFRPATATADSYMQGFFTGRFSFVESAFLCRADSLLAIGTTQGLLQLHPREAEKSGYIPPIAIDGPEQVSLSADQRTLTLTFAALDYNKRMPIRYAWRLEGQADSQWSHTTDHSIHLTNIPPGTSRLHLRSTNGDGVWVDNGRTVSIHRTPRFHERPVAWMLYGGLLLLTIAAGVKVVRYILQMRRELRHIRLTTGETIEYLTTRLQESLEKKTADNTQQPPVSEEETTPSAALPETDDERFCKRVKAFVTDNLNNPDLDINVFAREIGVSRSVLYLQMKRLFDCTPNNYLQEARLTHARRMLEAGHANISEVAYHCGFSDPKYFSRCFKKAVGKTPTEYIEQQGKEKAAGDNQPEA